MLSGQPFIPFIVKFGAAFEKRSSFGFSGLLTDVWRLRYGALFAGAINRLCFAQREAQATQLRSEFKRAVVARLLASSNRSARISRSMSTLARGAPYTAIASPPHTDAIFLKSGDDGFEF